MLDIFSDHVNISIKKVNISEFSKVPQSIDVRIASGRWLSHIQADPGERSREDFDGVVKEGHSLARVLEYEFLQFEERWPSPPARGAGLPPRTTCSSVAQARRMS
jgi:hypothetical protein